MLYVKLDENRNIVKYPYLLSHFQLEFPDIKINSLSEIESVNLEKNHIYPVQLHTPPDTTTNQKLQMANPLFVDGKWHQEWEIRNLTEQEIETRDYKLSLNRRAYRNKLLSESDWVVTKSVELGTPIPDEWLQYRQALRDLPTQPGFPHMVQFPKSPDTSLNSLSVPPTTIEE